MSSPIRLKRLMADYKRFAEVFKDHPHIAIKKVYGNPPEKYEIEYRVKSLVSRAGHIELKDVHVVEIFLPLGYPRQAPVCRMLTPVFHPNIAPHAICIGDHWAAGESLVHLVVRIGEMLAFQSYNIKSPLNGEAARWADQHKSELPTDKVDLSPAKRPEEITVDGQAAATAIPVAAVVPVARVVEVVPPVAVVPATPAAPAVPGAIPVAIPVAVPVPAAANAPQPAAGQVSVLCTSCGRSRNLPANSPVIRSLRCVYCGGAVKVTPAARP